MNRAARRARGYRHSKIRVSLEEWLAAPEKVVSRGELMLFVELHEENMHKRQRWLGRILDLVRRRKP